MELSFKEAIQLPTFYQVSYKDMDTNVMHFAYFSDRSEARDYENSLINMNTTQGTHYKLQLPCNRNCSKCGMCSIQ